jgi:NodT family efflux transporter outer membrane factor (OMF) lipoprotein
MPLSTRSLRAALVAGSALSLAACAAVGPNFKAPAGPTGRAAAGYAMSGDLAPAGVRLSPDARAAGPWWQAFGSPELDQSIRLALADSPSLAEARETLQRARAQAAATRGAQLPQVDANASAQRERINLSAFGFSGFPGFPPLSNPEISLFSVGGTVSYDLDLFGGKRRATEEANARAEQAARQADAAYLALSGNMALQAMQIAGLRAQIAAVNEIIAGDQRVIDMVRKAQAVGGESSSAITGGLSQLATDQTLLPPLLRQLEQARHQMALLAGKSPAEWTAPDFDIARLTVPTDVPISLPSELVRRRPDILAAEAEMHAATAAVGVAVANQYPDVRLSANLTQSALEPSKLFNYNATGWQLLSGVTAPIFHGGTLKAQRQAAEAEARASLARYQQTVIRAFAQVSDVLSNLGTDQAQIASLQQSVDAAQANLKDAENAYRLGGGPLINVVDAQRALSRSRTNLVAAQGQRLSDLVELYTATAADWRPGAQQTAAR